MALMFSQKMLPILFLVLRHHHRLVTLSETYRIPDDVFEKAYRTVDGLTDLLVNRVGHLVSTYHSRSPIQGM